MVRIKGSVAFSYVLLVVMFMVVTLIGIVIGISILLLFYKLLVG